MKFIVIQWYICGTKREQGDGGDEPGKATSTHTHTHLHAYMCE